MKKIIEERRETQVAMEVDVVVAGGGPAGFTAAVAAARNGSDVLLIEQQNYVGGMLACLPILGYCNYQGKQVIFGIAQELVERLVKRGGCLGHVVDPRLSSITPVDTEMLKIVTQEMTEEAGVRLLFHSLVVEPYMEGGSAKGVIVENKSGRSAVLSKVVVDATGDGDVAARAGAEFEIKEKSEEQPGNLMFRMDNVDVDKIRLAIARNPDNARTTKGFGCGADYYLGVKRFVLDGFTDQLAQARKNDDIPEEYPMQWVIIVTQPREDEVEINMAMATHFHSTDAFDLTRAEMDGRRWIPIVVDFLKDYIPGLKHAHLISSHNVMGVRESRRIIGDATLEPDDVMQSRTFPDGVAVASWGLSAGHHPKGKFRDKEYHTVKYPRQGLSGCEVRYGCLLPKGINGLLTAGRCISTTGITQNAIRVMAPCMSIGEAAGTAAALAGVSGQPPRHVDVAKLREMLTSQGARLLGDR